jgi:hypothetical protein
MYNDIGPDELCLYVFFLLRGYTPASAYVSG